MSITARATLATRRTGNQREVGEMATWGDRFGQPGVVAGASTSGPDVSRFGKQPQASPWYDVARIIMGMPRRIGEGIAGSLGDIGDLAASGIATVAAEDMRNRGWGQGVSPTEREEINRYKQDGYHRVFDPIHSQLSTSEDIRKDYTTPWVGEPYRPQTPAGQRAEIISNYATNLLSPGSGKAKILQTVVPMSSSLLSHELLGGSKYEPLAQFVSALTGTPFMPERAPPPQNKRPEALRAVAEAAPIPLTRGQATGDIAQQKAEQEMIHGGRGAGPQSRMAQHQAVVEQARSEEAERLRSQMAPVRGGTTLESGEALVQAARAEVAARKQTGTTK